MTLGARIRTFTFIAAVLALTLYPSLHAHAARIRDNSPMAPATVYASVSNVGVFRDSGPTDAWTGLTTLPSTSGALSLATGDAAHWRDVAAGFSGGVYASRDGGATWSAGLSGRTVRAVLIWSRSPSILLAGTDRGLYRSDDGGKTWASTSITRSVSALAQSAQGTIYAGGTGGVWVSYNGARRWASLRGGLPSGTAINALAAAGSTVYAATTAGVWRDTGGQWTQLRGGVPARGATSVAVTSTHVVAAIADDTLYVSGDNGATWTPQPIPGLASAPTALAQDARQADTLVAGGKNGTVEWSTDGGQTWSPLGSSVAGNGGSPILALAVVQREPLPVDPVPDPHQAGVVYTNGHTIQGAFLSVWQANQDVLGAPETEQFIDTKHGSVTAQYFTNMELLLMNGKAVPAPLGVELYQGQGTAGSYSVDTHFQIYWSAHQALLGPAISPLLKQPTGDGTGQSYPVQYFRNARLEYRPSVGSYVVTPGKLGDQALQALGWM